MSRLLKYAACGLLAIAVAVSSDPLGTGFTYQGKLTLSGENVSDLCDFEFGLWDAAAGGVELAAAVNVPGVLVSDGVFTVELDYGASVFDGDARWLEIAVACPTSENLTTLSPREVISATPYALHTLSISENSITTAHIVDGAVTSVKIENLTISPEDLADEAVIQQKLAADSVTGSKIAPGSVENTDLMDDAVTSAKIEDGQVMQDDLAADSVGSANVINGSIGFNDVNSAQVQLRVSGTCLPGTFMQAISSMGTVTCGVPSPAPAQQ